MSVSVDMDSTFVAFRSYPPYPTWTSGKVPTLEAAEMSIPADQAGRYRIEQNRRWAFGGMDGVYREFVKAVVVE